MTSEQYDFSEHLHRYACWAAARAASTSRFSNQEVEAFFSAINLRNQVKELVENVALNSIQYRSWFISVVQSLRQKFPSESIKGKLRKPSFGIAAKLISIYIKTVEVLPTHGQSNLAKIAYPPIDSILLRNLIKEKVPINSTTWSKMEQDEYMALIDLLSVHFGNVPLWKWERAWQV